MRYEEATPVFTQATFKKTVSEFTLENTDILTASATSSNLIGELLYGVVGMSGNVSFLVSFVVSNSMK